MRAGRVRAAVGGAVKVVVGVSGASGVQYAHALLAGLRGAQVDLVISEDAKKVIAHETDLPLAAFEKLADATYANDDVTAPPASGSYRFDAMVVIPCSMGTLGKIAWGISDNLITRAAAVCMKEKRKLILVPRETPLAATHLENMLRLANQGAVILPAMPGFYHGPKSMDDLVAFVVGKVLDQLGIEHALFRRWGE
jgi:4-hydroxy-3-polyprenylbenzoate decarboxylase